MVIALVVGALVLRVIYAIQLGGGPCLVQHRWDQTDMNFFHNWAMTIASGDWLTDRALHPYHRWHHSVAEDYFRSYPDRIEPMIREAEVAGISPPQLLWQRWWGGKRFHQEPLYPYLIAGTYRMFGPDVRVVFAWQLLLGTAGVVLVYLLARQAFGDTVGVIAGGMAVLCAPLMFYELVLLRAAPLAFAGLAAAFLTTQALHRESVRWWLGTGVTVGLAVLLKSTFLLYLVGLVGLLVWIYRRRPVSAGRAVGGLAGGVAICLGPLVVRNLVVGVSPMSMSSVGAISFLGTNAEDWVSMPGVWELALIHAPEIMDKTGGSFGAVVIETLKTHDSPWSVLGQLWGKFLATWHWLELPNNTNLYFYGLYAPVLKVMPVRFIMVAPLALVGLVVAWRRVAVCWPLYLLAAVSLAPLVISFNLSRYRLMMLAALIPFAALTPVRLVEWFRQRRYVEAGVAVAAITAAAIFIGRPLPEGVHAIRPSDYFAGHEFYYLTRVERVEDDPAKAAAILAEALAYEPAEIRFLGPFQPAQTAYESRLARRFAQLHLLCADYLDRAGDTAGAGHHRLRGEELQHAAAP